MIKKLLKLIIPPFFISLYKFIFVDSINFKGDYSNWCEAKNQSKGYESDLILSATKRSTEKVLSGDACYERDSVAFYTENYNWKLISFFLTIAIKRGSLRVVDFGGALASTYLQNKQFLQICPQLEWNVIEQKMFVEAGKELFKSNRIVHFYEKIQELENKKIDVLFMSCVLPYLESPYEILEDALKSEPEYLILDRHPFLLEGERDILTIQKVPSKIYSAAYPAWFFNKEILFSFLEQRYHLINESIGEDKVNYPCEYKTLFFKRITND